MEYMSVSNALRSFRQICAMKRHHCWKTKEPIFLHSEIKVVRMSDIRNIHIETVDLNMDCSSADLNLCECEEIIKFLEIEEKKRLISK